MKKFILLIMCLFLFGCGIDKRGCYETVKNTYPNGTVTNIPGSSWKFIVKENDNIYYIETMNQFSIDISFTYKIK